MKTKLLMVLLMLSGVLLSPSAANAALSAGAATNLSATRNIAYTQATSVTIRWSMTEVGAPPVTVVSTSGGFWDGAFTTALGTVPTVLSKTTSLFTTNLNFTETVRIPRDVLFKAYQQGFRQIGYRRTFNDGVGLVTISIVYTVTGSAGGAFGVSDYALRFSDGSLTTTVQQQQPLSAEARLNISGAGLLKGVWEVATPGSTSGTPFYSSLQRVTRHVSSGQTLYLQSPRLPNQQIGTYLVRFRLLQPALSQDPPAVQYFVGPRAQVTLQTVDVAAPAGSTIVNVSTRFQWQVVANADSYKIEIVADRRPQPGQPAEPVTGLLIKAAKQQATLSPSLLKRLKPNSTYWWHVLAFDKSGKIIAASDWRSLQSN